MANGLLDNKLQQPTAGMSYPEYHNIRSQQNAQSLLGRIGSGIYGFFKSPVQLGGQTERDILMAEIQNVLNEPRAKGEEISYSDAYNIALERLNPQPTTISQAVPEGRTYRPPKTTGSPIPSETQEILAEQRRQEEQMYDQAQQQGVTIDSSGNIVSGLPMTQGILASEPVVETQVEPVPPQSDGLMEIMVNPRRLDEKQFMQPRAQGILGTLGDLFGVNQPDFRDRLVMGLGALTFDPSNPLTQQASANIESRRQAEQAELDRQARLQIAQEQMRSAESIAQAEIMNDLLTAGQTNEFEEAALRTLGQQYSSWATGGRANALNRVSTLDEMDEILRTKDVSGSRTGLLNTFFGDLGLSLVNPDALTVKDTVEQIVSENLREILGGNFSEREGFRYMARGYNIYATPDENRRRLAFLRRGIQASIDAQDALYAHLNSGQPLKTYTGLSPEDAFKNVMNDPSLTVNLNWGSNPIQNYLEEEGITEQQWNNIVEQGGAEEFIEEYYSQYFD